MLTVSDEAVRPSANVSTPSSGTIVVTGRRGVSEGVVEFTLARHDNSRLPDWAPGAHIDVILPDGRVRQYSLCGDRWDATCYRIAVQRETSGRGGSAFLVDNVSIGDELGFGGPRNNFRLAPSSDYLFVAGGIGITPLLAMMRQAVMLDVSWRLLYLGRSRDRLAYLDELEPYEDRVDIHCADELGRARLDEWQPRTRETRVFACGPARLLDAVQAWGSREGGHAPKVERFALDPRESDRPSTTFTVKAARSGVAARVMPQESIVTALRRQGVDVLTSCAQGVCGTCQVDVLSGRPDHRDSILDDSERADAGCLYPCVSRSLERLLVLDV